MISLLYSSFLSDQLFRPLHYFKSLALTTYSLDADTIVDDAGGNLQGSGDDDEIFLGQLLR